MSRRLQGVTCRKLTLVHASDNAAPEAPDESGGGRDAVVDLGVESGAIFGLRGPHGAVWARAGMPDREVAPPDHPSAA
jgi:hypothetical protein